MLSIKTQNINLSFMKLAVTTVMANITLDKPEETSSFVSMNTSLT